MNVSQQALDKLLARLPRLSPCRAEIEKAYGLMKTAFEKGGKLLLCGNGGSAADCEHIVGELMKGFLKKRPLSPAQRQAFEALGQEGAALALKLQNALPCICLTGHTALSTAFANDVDPDCAYAQQLHGYAGENDVLLAISTSGNARNVYNAILAAKAHAIPVIGLTGGTGGRMREMCDALIVSPAKETYLIQEDHLPIYHTLCAMLESTSFEE
jgi:D-sedoheptulose 7-phosphate isomerase